VDLEAELLSVLNDPGRVWGGVVNNLEVGPRLLLLVFTTCKTPLSLTSWQAAVARVSTDTAVSFEAALRALDDSFVSIDKGWDGLSAEFRNPSMDDFCAAYLNDNNGIAVQVAATGPTYLQIERLLELGTARRQRQLVHPNLHRALIAESDLLFNRLLDLLPDDSVASFRRWPIVQSILNLLGQQSPAAVSSLDRARSSLAAYFDGVTFSSRGYELHRLMEDRESVVGLAYLLGARMEGFCDQVWLEANSISDFESLVNLDLYMSKDGRDAAWRDRFVDLTEGWIESGLDEDELESARDYYSKVSEHLDLKDLDRIDEWEEMISEVESNLPDRSGSDDSSWESDYDGEEDSPSYELSKKDDPVDLLFSGLLARE
jgi:hypothetical protein